MIILFEEYHYKTTFISKYLNDKYFYKIDAHKSKINHVGYYYNFNSDNNGEAVIILPKVFLNSNQKFLENYDPEEICNSSDRQAKIPKDIRMKLFEHSVWLYKAIEQYSKRQINTKITETNLINELTSNKNKTSSSELEIILSLINFFTENQTLFTRITTNSHSSLSKINWNKTINKQIPNISNNYPYYFNVNSLKRKINHEEELLIIFYSTLNFIKNKYHFNLIIPSNYTLFSSREFEKMLSKGSKHLKTLKGKFFTDKFILLIDLLIVYFDRVDKTENNRKIEEILLIKDFNLVFEDMIDALIGDRNLFPDLYDHPDGKQVDHIFRYNSLVLDDDIYFIGDSKYYKNASLIGKYSQAKQFTYAKNVIQHNINLFNQSTLPARVKYRDELTEGYNITPNFFITSFVENTLDFKNPLLTENSSTHIQYHYKNRLFDRDTLIVQSYNINFLFVLSSYVSKNHSGKKNFKNETRIYFRNKLISYINSKYTLIELTPSISLDEFIKKYFKLLIGKMYRPSSLIDGVLLAFEKDSDYQSILTHLTIDCKETKLHELR